MDPNLLSLMAAIVAPFTMDANLSAFLIAIVTSATTIILALLNMKKQASIEKKVDAGNLVTTATHTIANGRTDSLMKQLEEKNAEIQRLSLLAPPPDPATKP
jgi:ribosomal protein L11